MAFAISPIHRFEDFPSGLTLENKIDVFIARVRGWQIQPALDMIQRRIPHRGFAQLHIVSSYFELIAKYVDGFVGSGRSKESFKRGLLYTFPEISKDDEQLQEAFYQGIRNGLYHNGMTLPNVIIYNRIPEGSFGFNKEHDLIMINPDRFVEDVAIKFNMFAEELRNPANRQLRSNFEVRFDSPFS